MKIALDTDRVSLIHGDSLAVLKSFADKSFDVVLTDPPYGEHVHAKLGKERRNDGRAPRHELEFPPMTEELVHAVMAELVRVCKGWIIVFSDQATSHVWGEAAVAAGGSWPRTGAWVKTNPMPQMTGDRPASGHEDIAICHAERKGFAWNGHGHAAAWRGSRDPGYGLDPHPNQKPLWLTQALIGMFAPPNALVLDPYFGSGSTALGALATERLSGESLPDTACPKCVKKLLESYQPPLPTNASVVGVEGSQRWVDVAIHRIAEAVPALLVA